MALEPDDVQMSFGEHLEELRRRIILAMAGIAVGCAVAFYFWGDLVLWLLDPLHRTQRDAGLPAVTIGLGVGTGFAVAIKVSLVAGAIFASPWIIYQAWKFVSAGLYSSERRVVAMLGPFSAVMAALGVAFAYYILLPVCLAFLINFTLAYPDPGGAGPGAIDVLTRAVSSYSGRRQPPPAAPVDPSAATEVPATQPAVVHALPVLSVPPASPVEGQMWIDGRSGEVRVHFGGQVRSVMLITGSLVNQIEINEYIGFVAFMMLGVVAAFQLPLVMLLTGWTGVIDPAMLASYRKYAVFVCFVLGAVLTPADPISMFVLALPLWALFELGLFLMRLVRRQRTAEGE